ncbi:MAG: toll/interleukin-1 receptor domain-containing protein [Hyphomonadaceae bacterium]|nr:toll/interleukin-1 receptor domain-containing protein [Hyphomonadaceae bacterium]
MTDVFISYKKEDVDRVRLIAEALAQAGYEVWWDHRIPPGRTYREVIGAALQTAKCVIVVWSEKSVESQWVLDEADAGQQRRVLLPILIDNVMPPYGFGQIEAARLIDWDGDTSQIEWQHTVGAVAHLVGREPGAAAPVSIAMPSGGGAMRESPAVTLATPGATLDKRDAAAASQGGGGGKAGLILGALVLLGALGGGAYYAIANNLFSGSLPPDGPEIVDGDEGPLVVTEPTDAPDPELEPQPQPDPEPEPQPQPEPEIGFPGVNGMNVMSATQSNGRQIVHLRDGFWAVMGSNGLPEVTFQEYGRDDWSVYMVEVGSDTQYSIDIYMRQFKQMMGGELRPRADLASASTQSGQVPRISRAHAFVFGDGLRFERNTAGPSETWVEVDIATGQRSYVWTKVHEDQHFMELTDDGRGARMRVDLIQKQVYLYFPDWGQFNPQWPVTDVQWR